jgi:tetratricopeptide (TPR) repeat protein
LQRKHAEVEALVQEVTRYNPAPGLFYHELAARLEGRRWYEPAEKYYHKAVELHPRLAGPRNSLGLLYMRLGQEDEARKILTTAFEMDPFNVRVANMLKVLRHLDKYDALKSEHFALRYDPKNDRALVHFMAEFLEEVYTGLAKQYNYHPPRPILVEIFNTHEMFSGRVVALPDLHTIGACTGRMVAMMSPQGKRNGLKITPFNWARVLRHELVHIFNLEQTNFLAPHWLTEGLAVANEGYPRPQSWNEMLLQRVPAGDLMTLEDIDLGFIRPRSPQEWKLAYCQSQLYVDYLIQVYGEKSIGDMLAAYRDGLDTGAAVARACRVDRAVFEKGYRAYLDSMTRGLKGKPPVKPQTFTQLREAHKKDPHNVDVTARLAEQYFSRDKAESRKLAGEALAGKAGHPLASYVLARLELAGGNPAGASKLLEAGLDRTEPEPKVLRELGKIYYNASQFDRAVEIFELGRKVEPYERQWLIELGRVQAQLGNRDRQIEVLTALVPTDPDDFDNRKRLARLLMEAGRFAEAERYGKQALEIDFRDQEAREIYEKALRSQNKKEQADRFQKVFSK